MKAKINTIVMNTNLSLLAKSMLALEVDCNKSGIYIIASVYQRQDGVNSIRLMGVCQDTLSKCSGMQPTMLHAVAIIFTKTPDHSPTSISALGDTIVFNDDVEVNDTMCRAFFLVDVFDCTNLKPETGRYFISAVFGENLSNIIEISF